MMSFLRSPGTTPIKAKFGRRSLATYHNYKQKCLFTGWIPPLPPFCSRTRFCHKVLFDCFSLTSHKDQLNPQLDPLP